MCKTVVRSAVPFFFFFFLAWHTCHCNPLSANTTVHNTKTDGYAARPFAMADSQSPQKKKPQSLEIMFTPRHQNDDGDITWIKETNLRR